MHHAPWWLGLHADFFPTRSQGEQGSCALLRTCTRSSPESRSPWDEQRHRAGRLDLEPRSKPLLVPVESLLRTASRRPTGADITIIDATRFSVRPNLMATARQRPALRVDSRPQRPIGTPRTSK